jgi:hypothetical protein
MDNVIPFPNRPPAGAGNSPSPGRAAAQDAETALLLAAIRHDGILRHVVLRNLTEQVNDLVVSPDRRDVENSVIGLVAALRPMLLRTVNAFFDMSDDERARHAAVRNDLRTAIHEAEMADPDSEVHYYPPPDPEADRAWSTFYETTRALDLGERRRLAVEFITKPVAMIRNVQAAETLRDALDLMPGSEINDWAAEDVPAGSAAINSTDHLLAMLRDRHRSPPQ